MNGKADTSPVSQALAATPEAARKTGDAVRRNPVPVAAAAIVLAGAAAAIMRLRAMRKPQTRAQKMRAAVSGIPSRLPSRKQPSMMSQVRSRLGMR